MASNTTWGHFAEMGVKIGGGIARQRMYGGNWVDKSGINIAGVDVTRGGFGITSFAQPLYDIAGKGIWDTGVAITQTIGRALANVLVPSSGGIDLMKYAMADVGGGASADAMRRAELDERRSELGSLRKWEEREEEYYPEPGVRKRVYYKNGWEEEYRDDGSVVYKKGGYEYREYMGVETEIFDGEVEMRYGEIKIMGLSRDDNIEALEWALANLGRSYSGFVCTDLMTGSVVRGGFDLKGEMVKYRELAIEKKEEEKRRLMTYIFGGADEAGGVMGGELGLQNVLYYRRSAKDDRVWYMNPAEPNRWVPYVYEFAVDAFGVSRRRYTISESEARSGDVVLFHNLPGGTHHAAILLKGVIITFTKDEIEDFGRDWRKEIYAFGVEEERKGSFTYKGDFLLHSEGYKRNKVVIEPFGTLQRYLWEYIRFSD